MIPNSEQMFLGDSLSYVCQFRVLTESDESRLQEGSPCQCECDTGKDCTSSGLDNLTEICTKAGCQIEDIPNFVTGGVQQYLNRLNQINYDRRESKKNASVCIYKQPESVGSSTTISSLPVYVKLHILSYLEASDLCRLSRVSREWCDLTNDNVLWNNLLERDMLSWEVVGHTTNPAVYREVNSDWPNKSIYLQCCPKLRKMMRQNNLAFMNISSMLRSFLPKKVPKIAMFGPGLESNTSTIVRKILHEKNNLFDIKHIFPGQFEGVGSGMTLQMKTGQSFHLSVLYSSTKREREARPTNRMGRNRLVQQNMVDVEAGRIETSAYELTPAVRDLCRTLDAFIYVVDATVGSHSDNLDNSELFAMVTERWSATHVPVLVLSCVAGVRDTRIPCVEVVRRLQLNRLDKPWQVQDCDVDSLSGVVEGVQWVIEQSQRR